MKKITFCFLCLFSLAACATSESNKALIETDNQTWNGSVLPDSVITQVQTAKQDYRLCVYTEAQKKGYTKIDTRVATDAIIKQCESSLSKIHTIFTEAKVPQVIINRFLKKTRVTLTRKILKSLMFSEATRAAGIH